MSRSSRCDDCSCEFVPSVNKRESSPKRSEDELRYGKLWAEIELPKLLACKEQDREDDKRP